MTTYLTNLILFGWVFVAWDHFKRKKLNLNGRGRAPMSATARAAAKVSNRPGPVAKKEISV